MSLIQCIDLGIEFSGKYILKDINCTIEHNSRIGLIGSNGSGKTTLIKMIQGVLRPTEGKVIKAKGCKIAYLEQNATLEPELTLIGYAETARADIRNLKHRMEALSARLREKDDDAIHKELNAVIEKMHQVGAFEHENEISFVLQSLGFPETVWHKRIGDFSGGEQTRICLAYLLLCRYDLLILDEPTNHLDIAMIRWLEKYLSENTKPYLVVSHDRVFLDNIARSIYAIENGKLNITKGNYSSYYEARQIAMMSQQRQFERQQRFISETEAFIQKNMAGQKTKQAKSRLKMLEKMEVIAKPNSGKQVQLKIKTSARSGNDVYRFQDVSFGIGSDLLLAQDVNIAAYWQERIAVIGPNGCGKSTLMKLLIGKHGILSGHLYTGASLKVAYYDQHQCELDENLTVMQTLWNIVPAEPQGYVLSWLARFGFRGDDVDKQVAVLSGGEKSRLYLSVLIHEKPNLLILDEPTNHLDISMHDALLEALQDFDGTIIFVSHDRHFISSLAHKYWVFTRRIQGNSIINTIEEPDLDAEAAIELAFSEPELPKHKPATAKPKKRKTNPWLLEQIQNELNALQDEKVERLRRLNEIHGRLADSATYSDSSMVKKLNEEERIIQARCADIDEKVLGLEDEYLLLVCDE